MIRIAVFASGYGSNFNNIAEFLKDQDSLTNVQLGFLFCNKENAHVLSFAKKHNVKTYCFSHKSFSSKQEFEQKILSILKLEKIDYIFLAGYMLLVGETLLNAYPNKIINIHPSLLPLYKGKQGFLDSWNSKDIYLGATTHYVDSTLDGGDIILQEKFLNNFVNFEDAQKELAKIEKILYLKTLKKLFS